MGPGSKLILTFQDLVEREIFLKYPHSKFNFHPHCAQKFLQERNLLVRIF